MGIVLSPHPVLASTTENVKAIQLGTSAIQSPTKTYRNDTSTAEYHFDPNSYIYFGQVSSADSLKPIKWRVLDAKNTLAGTSGMFLFAETSLGQVAFFPKENDIEFDNSLHNYENTDSWENSNARTQCQELVKEGNKNFTTEERSMIESHIIKDTPCQKPGIFSPDPSTNPSYTLYKWENSDLTEEDQLFYLSVSELERYVANYDGAPSLKFNSGNSTESSQWGLRSFFSTAENATPATLLRGLAYVSSNQVHGFPESNSKGTTGAHPAMNIKKEDILFTKSTYDLLTQPLTPSNSTSSTGVKLDNVILLNQYNVSKPYSWTLVLKDDKHKDFSANLGADSKTQQPVGYSDWEIVVKYEDAEINSNSRANDSSTGEYISAMLVDSTGEVLCYGGQKVTAADGEVGFAMPEGLEQGRYTLKVFNEQRNGNEKTDYSSGFADIPLTVGNPSSGSGSSGTGSSNGVRMYRLYNPNSGEHFYTARLAEKEYLVRQGWSYEGVAWIAPRESNRPVYRLYNPNAGDHHYTMNLEERDALIALGWKDEGIGWYSSPGKEDPIYRQYNPNASSGTHNYTRSKDENDYLTAIGWRPEGIGWYGIQWNLPSSEEK